MTAESHAQYAIYTAGLGHSAFLPQGDPPYSVWVGFLAGPLCMKPLDPSVPPGQAYVQITAQHPPGWVFANPNPILDPLLGISTFPSDCVLSPCVQEVCSVVVNPGEPRNPTLVCSM